MTLQIAEAYEFYKEFILNYSHRKAEIYKRYGFTLQGSIGSKDWEVFTAILLDDRARPGDGADLMNYEVKSAVTGSGFEYQYHKFHGLEKLQDDMQINHVFVARSIDFQNIEVWLVQWETITPIFEDWRPALLENYQNPGRQRFRRSVSYKFVSENGRLLLQILNGQLITL
ncbi:MAG: hypothetical protein R3D55_10160 [Chloroflexota bacterium]